jgi:hypothetical protein
MNAARFMQGNQAIRSGLEVERYAGIARLPVFIAKSRHAGVYDLAKK